MPHQLIAPPYLGTNLDAQAVRLHLLIEAVHCFQQIRDCP
jgi:hypothetical protein